jgi:hypothetical protein
MGKMTGIAVGAGMASALLFVVSATASLAGMALAYLTPLPIMIAALGFGHVSGGIAAVVGASTVGLALGAFPGLTFLVVLGLPAWWLAYVCLLARPGQSGVPEWYPLAKVVVWMALLAAAPVMIVGALLVVHYGGFDRLVAIMAAHLEVALAGARLPGGITYTELVRAAPVAVAASTFVMLAANLWLGGRVVRTSQRLARPWPNIADGIRLPPRIAILFFALLAAAFLPDPPGLVAAVAAAAFAMAFVFEGLAAAHVVTRGLAARRLILSAIYATILFLMPWPLLALALLGCLDSLFALRGRIPGPPSPPTPYRS